MGVLKGEPLYPRTRQDTPPTLINRAPLTKEAEGWKERVNQEDSCGVISRPPELPWLEAAAHRDAALAGVGTKPRQLPQGMRDIPNGSHDKTVERSSTFRFSSTAKRSIEGGTQQFKATAPPLPVTFECQSRYWRAPTTVATTRPPANVTSSLMGGRCLGDDPFAAINPVVTRPPAPQIYQPTSDDQMADAIRSLGAASIYDPVVGGIPGKYDRGRERKELKAKIKAAEAQLKLEKAKTNAMHGELIATTHPSARATTQWYPRQKY